MNTYLKSLILSLFIFSILYWGLTSTVGHNIGQMPSDHAISFVYILGLLSWVISAYIFATLNKRRGLINGMLVFNKLSLLRALLNLVKDFWRSWELGCWSIFPIYQVCVILISIRYFLHCYFWIIVELIHVGLLL